MSWISQLELCEQDERVRKILYPTRILKTWGHVENEELLLNKKTLQIGLHEPSVTTFENNKNEIHAAVLLDFGTELHGSLRILCAAISCAGAAVRVSLGESAAEAVSQLGEKHCGNDHSIRTAEIQLPSLSDNEYFQTGFRFALVELLTPSCKISLKSIVSVMIYRHLDYLGSFSCDDETINRIYDTAAYTVHLTMQNYLWDGVKRDRLVWVGDMHPEILTIKSVFGQHPIVENSLRFAMEQTSTGTWMNNIPSYSMWWIWILYDWYFYTGNLDFMKENRNYILSLCSQLAALVGQDGSDTLPSYFLDWPTRGHLSAIEGVRSLLMIALEAACAVAKILKDEDCACRCTVAVQKMKTCVLSLSTERQITAFEWISHRVNVDQAAQMLSQDTVDFSTFMSYYILTAVAQTCGFEQALQQMRAYYGAMLDCGATTFWEDFHMDWARGGERIDELPDDTQVDLHGDHGDHCYKGFRHSLCHGWASGPVPFLCENVLGIKILEPGCKTISIQPQLGNLHYAEGSFPTPYGCIHVRHEKMQDGKIHTEVRLPKEIKCV